MQNTTQVPQSTFSKATKWLKESIGVKLMAMRFVVPISCKIRISIVLLVVCCLACKTDRGENGGNEKLKPESELVFDKVKWNTKDGADYSYMDKMLNDIVYNDTVRSLNKDEILDLLGEPSYYRSNESYLYYLITRKRLVFWPLHTKTLVIKLSEDDTIDWIKIHE